ncbi:MAG: hypothetical protein M3Q23_05490 [Actinomycetota bacterium]|nr:hypothetical protein [Actinomycetota bacterium]
MIDLERELASLDLLEAPDLSVEIDRRAGRPDLDVPGERDRRRAPLRPGPLVAAALALAAGVAAAVLLMLAFRPPPSGSPATTRPTPSSIATTAQDPWESLPAGWTRVANLPGHRTGAVTVWTGRQLVYWGGVTDAGTGPPDGFAYDPVAGTWHPLPESPLSAREEAWPFWTGTDVLIWGGRSSGGLPLMDGAAFDPSTDTWRTIPKPPLNPRFPAAVVWTGRELIVWGGGPDRAQTYRDGAAFDPESNSWRTIAPGPLLLNLATSVWTGREVIAFGADLDGGNQANTDFARGAAYDPATDSWRVIAPSDLSPQASAVAWTGREMVAWDYELHAAAYDAETDQWRDLPPIPLDFSECYPSTAFAASTVLAWYCGGAAVLDVGTGTWTEATPSIASAFRPGLPVAAGSAIAIATEQGVNRGPSDAGQGLWIYRPATG